MDRGHFREFDIDSWCSICRVTERKYTQINRRPFIKIANLLPLNVFVGTGAYTTKERAQCVPIVFNLVSWSSNLSNDESILKTAINNINDLGLHNITIITYRFVNRRAGKILQNNIYGLKSPPINDTIAVVIHHANNLGMSVGLNPFIEIDNVRGIGSSWRGELDFSEKTLGAFFSDYGSYIEDMANLAQTAGARRLYVGSELAALSRNPGSLPHWTRLVRQIRKAFNGKGRRLAYAANHDEFEAVPFWEELDDIGIDAYFSLATRAEATGVGKPPVSTMIASWQKYLELLRLFGRQHNKPVIISEWGVVPLDLTSYQPWNWRPSALADKIEQLNAYRATLEVTKAQGGWLSGIDFWHWQMPGNEGSQYGISADSMVGHLIGNFVRGEANGCRPD